MSLSIMGIFHTLLGLVALVTAFQLLWKHKRISYRLRVGLTYVVATLLTAASALTIFRHGGFNAAHGLAILTLLAASAGVILEKTGWFKSWNKYWVNLCYSSTLLFHLIPTATEILTRFPVENPVVSSLKDPFLQQTFLVIVIGFMIMLLWQLIWLRKQPN